MPLTFKLIPHGSTAWQAAVALREAILRKPLSTCFSQEELAEEAKHVHVAGYLDGVLVATAALVPEKALLKMQRVAVQDSIRNQNIGSQMMSFCEAFARTKGYTKLYCHARDSAVNFYLKNGYSAVGGYFDEDGIPHLKMIKQLE